MCVYIRVYESEIVGENKFFPRKRRKNTIHLKTLVFFLFFEERANVNIMRKDEFSNKI